METYTFSHGTVGRGLFLSSDEKLGLVLLLGESGRGQTLIKVGLDRRNPAEVKGSGVFNAVPTKITLPAKEGRPEISFFVLTKPKEETREILVRINTVGTYTKNTYGTWLAVEGKPETVVSGHGAHGDAGRIGGWADSLAIMHPGDVIKVTLSGGHKYRPYALVCAQDGTLTALDFDEWQKAQAQAKAVTGQAEVEIQFGMMSAFSFDGQITAGIKSSPGLAGPVVVLGEEGRGRKIAIIPLVNLPKDFTRAGVGKTDGNVVLASTDGTETDKVLVRIDTRGFYKRGHPGKVEVLRGNPQRVAYGYYAQGDAGGIYSMADDLWVVGVGDVLKVEIEGYDASHNRALYLKEGVLVEEKLRAWKLQDALRDPNPYIAKNLCPLARLPEEWVGSIVAVYDSNFGSNYGPERYALVSVNPVAFDSGWNDIAPSPYNTGVRIRSDMVWVERLPDLVWQKLLAPIDMTEKIEFHDLPQGQRVRAIVSTSFSEAAQKYVYSVSLPTLYGVKYQITWYEKDGKREGLPKEIERGDYTFLATSDTRTIFVRGEEKELNGEFFIEFIDGHIEVYTESFLRKEVEEIKAAIEADQALRKLARPLNLSSEQKRKLMLEQNDEAYGLPVDATWRPCPPVQAERWVAFHRHFPWPAFPKLYVLQRVSFRSLSEGKTFEEFRAVYMRKI